MEIEAIQKLIETDEQVRQQIQDVYQQRNEARQALEAQKKQLSDSAWARVKEQVDQTRKELDEGIVQEDTRNQEYLQQASAQLQQLYDAHKETWRKALFERVIDPQARDS